MVVVSMTNCPPKLRGDLSKWLLEINTGVYIGHVNAKVRDALWERICDNIGTGQATMVFTANNEQHMDFYVHNTSWKSVDYDGIKIMKHLFKPTYDELPEIKTGFSDAAKRRMGSKRHKKFDGDSYIMLDIETTGLSCEKDEIIEIGAVRFVSGEIRDKLDFFIYTETVIPKEIQRLTGIKNETLEEYGVELEDALKTLFKMIEGQEIFIYNADFDLEFLKKNAAKFSLEFPDCHVTDILDLARNKLKRLDNYRLSTVAKSLDVRSIQRHRAIDDCRLLNEVFKKLNDI